MPRIFLRALLALTLALCVLRLQQGQRARCHRRLRSLRGLRPAPSGLLGRHAHPHRAFVRRQHAGHAHELRRRVRVRARRAHPAPALQRRRNPDPDGGDRSAFGLRHAERPCGVPRHLEGLQRSELAGLRRGSVPAVPGCTGVQRGAGVCHDVFVRINGLTAIAHRKTPHYPELCGPGDDDLVSKPERTSGVAS